MIFFSFVIGLTAVLTALETPVLEVRRCTALADPRWAGRLDVGTIVQMPYLYPRAACARSHKLEGAAERALTAAAGGRRGPPR